MRQDAAAADDQIQFQHVDEGLAGRALFEHIGNGALLLDAFEPRSERLMVNQRQPQAPRARWPARFAVRRGFAGWSSAGPSCS